MKILQIFLLVGLILIVTMNLITAITGLASELTSKKATKEAVYNFFKNLIFGTITLLDGVSYFI
ncbi:hypothetical protein [Enterococcus sp. HY326]|uniref:hypothetical protein n=1 Tax=Enterococcus sp. HY326 TaxID=2971265 RepID=UPI0022404008|nr:hypothetical protein [Enterococcus sp. HY326]